MRFSQGQPDDERCCDAPLQHDDDLPPGILPSGLSPCAGSPGGLAIDVGVGLDLLLADLLRDLRLVGDRLLLHAHPLLRHRALLHHRLLLAQHNLVLLLGDRRPVERLIHVRVGDRLTLHANLLTLDRDRRLHLLGHHVLAQPRAATLTLRRTDPQLLLRASHRLVGRRAARIAPDLVAARSTVSGREPAVRVMLGVAHPVMLVELGLLLLGELAVRIVDARRVLDLRLRERHPHVLACGLCTLDRDKGQLRSEHAGAHHGPFRRLRVLVAEQLLERPDLVAVGVDDVSTPPVVCLRDLRHGVMPPSSWTLGLPEAPAWKRGCAKCDGGSAVTMGQERLATRSMAAAAKSWRISTSWGRHWRGSCSITHMLPSVLSFGSMSGTPM